MAVVTPSDRPKSVSNRDVIEVYGDILCCHIAVICWYNYCRSFFHRTESDLFPFLLTST